VAALPAVSERKGRDIDTLHFSEATQMIERRACAATNVQNLSIRAVLLPFDGVLNP